MKKIVITESQLERVTKSISEQFLTQPKETNLEGRKAIINTDGTISIFSNTTKNFVKLRFSTKNMGDVNFRKFEKNPKGTKYDIETKLNKQLEFPIEKVVELLNFVDSNKKVSDSLGGNFVTGTLTAEKRS